MLIETEEAPIILMQMLELAKKQVLKEWPFQPHITTLKSGI